MKAGVPNLAVPQDNILFAALYDFAKKRNIKYFFSGANYALECILQGGNTHNPYDVVNLLDIHNRFGTEPIDKLTFISEAERNRLSKEMGIQTVSPLDFVDYNRDRAIKELFEFCGFEYYGSKHLENDLTAFIQLYWFPKKFGVDKRTSHLSSMIVSGQLARDEALRLYLETPLCDERKMTEYINTIKTKLRISDEEFVEIMAYGAKRHSDYATA